MGTKGLITNVTEFALHDGPGIRTTVFFKGCPLHCQWCHNPETQSFHKELMVSQQSCRYCGRCITACTSPDNCTACGACVSVCPLRIREICGEEIDAEQLAGLLLKNRDLFVKSNGGITITGGEPLAQSDFYFSLTDALGDVHIALDTCGYASNDVFSNAIKQCSLVLFDVKLMDEARHLRYTEVGNALILDNLSLLCVSDTPFIIRVPLISGVNDDIVFADSLCRRIHGAGNLIRVDLLPYHKGAGSKYEMLRKSYLPEFDQDAVPEVHFSVFKEYGISVIVN